MPSNRKVAANRRNAQKSAGPRTLSGKAIASMNALKHGLSARSPLIPGEDEAEFTAYTAAWVDELKPAGAMQEFLAERIIAIAWRLRRIGRLEAALFEPEGGEQGGSLSKLVRYETALEKSFYRNLKELRELQAADSADCADDDQADLQNEPTDEQAPANQLVSMPPLTPPAMLDHL